MKRTLSSAVPLALTVCLAALLSLTVSGRSPEHRATAAESDGQDATPLVHPPPSVAEARVRARILHEAIHGTLQVMHRDFFDEESSVIPSNSLEDVFHELARAYQVELRWLTVNTDVLNADHKPQNAFEDKAVEALRAGNGEFEATEGDAYRFAGAIRLSSQCLKCHVKRRISNQERVAGLLIKMPVSE